MGIQIKNKIHFLFISIYFIFFKKATKPPERTISPMPLMTNINSTSSPTNIVNVHTTAPPSSNNTSNSSTPANAFAGAIKSLTQKYKTMHLNTSSSGENHHHHITHLNATINLVNTSSNSSNPTPTHFNANSYKSAYTGNTSVTPNINHYNMSNSLDFGMNNTSNNSSSGGEQTTATTTNSDSISSSDADKQTTANSQTCVIKHFKLLN